MRFSLAVVSAAVSFFALGAEAGTKKCSIKTRSLASSVQTSSTTGTSTSSPLSLSASTSQSSVITTTQTTSTSSSSGSSASTTSASSTPSSASASTSGSTSSTSSSLSTSTSSSSSTSSTPSSTSSTSTSSPTTSAVSTTTTASTTSTSTTTSSATTPTVNLQPRPQNLGFDDSPTSFDPWELDSRSDGTSLTLDSTFHQAGENSLKFGFGASQFGAVQQRFDASQIQANVNYELAVYVFGSSGCAAPHLSCGYDDMTWDSTNTAGNVAEWQDHFTRKSLTCSWPPVAIAGGNLWIRVGWLCSSGTSGWVDSVSFGPASH